MPEDHKSKTFTHTLRSGKSVTLPAFASAMTFGRARRLRKLSESEQVFTMLEEIADEDTLAALDEMDSEETEEFFTAYAESSGANLGESSSSSD